MTNTSKGIIYLILSAFSFAAMALFVRLAGEINFIQKAFFRNAVALIIALGFLIREGQEKGWDSVAIPKGAIIFLFIRATAGSIGIFGNFYAIDRLVLSDAAILNKMSPFFAVFFSIFLMKEKVRLVPMLAITGAFLGAMLVVKPSFDFSATLPTLAGFIGGVGAGLAYACVRKLSSLKCNGKVIVLFFSVYSCLLSLPHMIFHWEAMTSLQLTFLILAGVWAACGQFSITAAYFHAPAREISIYDYSQVIFSASFGFFVFGMVPDWMSLTGYAVIISMAVLNFAYNKRMRPEQ